MFYIAPSLALDGILDYATDKGWKYFKKAIKKLADKPFDLVLEERHLLTNFLTKRADEIGWNTDIEGIILISIEPIDSNSNIINILINYGELTLKTICKFESIYINKPLCNV